MPAIPYTIAPFRDLPEVVEIIALGQIRRQPDRALEAEIEVVLASHLEDGAFDPQVNVYRRWVGCGQIDLLTVGSCWKKGRYVRDVEEKKYTATYSFGDSELLGAGSEEPTDGLRCLPTRSVKNAPCFLLTREGAREGDLSGPRKVLLPQMELVRALFGVSGRFLLQLIDGLRDPLVLDRGILDRARSVALANGTVRLVCWRRPTDEEALILATMVADPTIMRFHDEVFQQLVVQREFRDDKPTWPEVTWPFAEPVRLRIKGRWFQRDNEFKRFLATRILEIELRSPFRRIEVLHLGASNEEPPDRSPPSTRRIGSINARLVVLTTGRPPSSSRRLGQILSAPVVILGSEGVTIDYVGMGGPSHPPSSTLGEDPREEGEFSTASRESGGDPNLSRVEIRRTAGGDANTPISDCAESLRATWAAIKAAAASAGWNVTPYPAGDGQASAGCGGFDFRSEGILTGLNVGGRHVILADDGTTPGDRRSLGILIPTMARPVNSNDLRSIRKALKRHGGRWGSDAMKIMGFEISAVRRHPKVWKDRDAYVALLRRRVGQAISGGAATR